MFANISAQSVVSGTVYDSSRIYGVPGVIVSSTSGSNTLTDSLGAYHIRVSQNDSISFLYKGKSTVRFPVNSISDTTAFDISLRVRINTKYKMLKPVTVFADNYQQDSAENRMEYSKIFNYEKSGIRSSYEEGGPAGLDLDALISALNRTKRKENLAFQKRLVEDEQDKYVKYRFNPKLVRRITGLRGDTLTQYMKLYTPSYEFISESTLTEFYQYILNTSYAFKRDEGILK